MRLYTLTSSVGLVLVVASRTVAQQPVPESFVLRDLHLQLAVDYTTPRLAGTVTMEMENWTTAPASTVSFLLHRLMDASKVTDRAGAPLQYTQSVRRFVDDSIRQVTHVVVELPHPIAPSERATVRIEYGGFLTPYTEVGWLYVKDHIDSAFTIIRTDALAFPEIGGLSDAANRRMPPRDFTYEADVRVPAKYAVATGGDQTKTLNSDGTITWHYESVKRSPFLNISIAPFDTLSAGGIRVFYFPGDSVGARTLLKSTRAALDTMTAWFGPLHTKTNLTVTEIPTGWGSQSHLVGGIIQEADAFQDPRYMAVFYHELSHLWNADDTDSPSPRWNEGLAMFMQYLLREKIDSWPRRAIADSGVIARAKQKVATDSLWGQVPMIDYGKRRMTDASYVVGNLMFSTLYYLLGQSDFNRVVGGYYQKFAPTGGTTRDFVSFAKENSSRDLSSFFDDWIFTTRWTKVVAAANTIAELASHYDK